MADLLIAIDGTDAKEYYRSWIKLLYKNFQGSEKQKVYNDDITTLGREVEDVIKKLKIKIDAMIKEFGADSRLCIIGHSRGGYVAIQLANHFKTYYLGLLDPVNMKLNFTDGLHHTSDIPKAEHIFYAKRDDSFTIDSALAHGSLVTTLYSDTRIYFGYALNASVVPRKYKTSHGGIGGDPFPKEENFNWFKNTTGYFNDVTCKATVLRKPIYSGKLTIQEALKLCEDESDRVWLDFKRSAEESGLSLGASWIKDKSNTSGKNEKILKDNLGELFANGRKANASELIKYGKSQGWKAEQSTTGPLTFFDKNGVKRMAIKQGSERTPGSEVPHVALKNGMGKRIDPLGNIVSKRSQGNHTPINYDIKK